MTYAPELIDLSGPSLDHNPEAWAKVNAHMEAVAAILNAYPAVATLMAFMASRGTANGLCDLDANIKIPASRLPSLAINDTFLVTSEAAMLALTAERGDVALRTEAEVDKVYILAGDDPSVLSNWIEWLYPTDVVVSVEGRAGVVTLSDILQPVSARGQASGYPALDSESLVVQNPASASATPGASKIPVADGEGKLDGWIGAKVPVGTILDYGGVSAPAGYLGCDGSAVSRTTYAALFAAIGTTWGVGDGSATFNVPDLRRRATVGSGGTGTATLGNAVGNAGGEETHQLTIAEMPNHDHGGATGAGPDLFGGGTAFLLTTGGGYDHGWINDHTHTISAQGGGEAHSNMQPSAVVSKIIRY